jgi:hypothetical protein
MPARWLTDPGPNAAPLSRSRRDIKKRRAASTQVAEIGQLKSELEAQ